MSSIHQQQPEDVRHDLAGSEAVERIRETVKKVQTGFFCTAGGSRPMNVREVDDNGTLWFLSANDSRKNADLESNPAVTLYFQGSEHSDFLMLAGTATVSRDRARIEQLWKPVIKTWFTGGVDDPRITVIEVVPTDGYYWDNKHGDAVAGIKMLIGAATGKTLDDSIEGHVRLDAPAASAPSQTR
jgi:general stress protein 26